MNDVHTWTAELLSAKKAEPPSLCPASVKHLSSIPATSTKKAKWHMMSGPNVMKPWQCGVSHSREEFIQPWLGRYSIVWSIMHHAKATGDMERALQEAQHHQHWCRKLPRSPTDTDSCDENTKPKSNVQRNFNRPPICSFESTSGVNAWFPCLFSKVCFQAMS